MNQREHEAWVRDIEEQFGVEREEAQEILRGIKAGGECIDEQRKAT